MILENKILLIMKVIKFINEISITNNNNQNHSKKKYKKLEVFIILENKTF